MGCLPMRITNDVTRSVDIAGRRIIHRSVSRGLVAVHIDKVLTFEALPPKGAAPTTRAKEEAAAFKVVAFDGPAQPPAEQGGDGGGAMAMHEELTITCPVIAAWIAVPRAKQEHAAVVAKFPTLYG